MNKNDLSTQPHILAHESNGFSMQFANGLHVSVIWHEFSYSEYGNRVKKGEMNPDDYHRRCSKTAEVLVTHKDGRPIRVVGFGVETDDVIGHLSPEALVSLLAKVASANPVLDIKTVHIL
ncbi:hypothetical protein UFOVP401_43 [uncultured Caudovirales phage]|uniref:Uncharacterized protein n=1 Tax=uncultured Caudovirales phage TaxID=2100421 RepID=A0A6J5M1Z6_9CAUD|nr:hypothetical protein UFOVP401_43 [uncultured Caudovirales phage]